MTVTIIGVWCVAFLVVGVLLTVSVERLRGAARRPDWVSVALPAAALAVLGITPFVVRAVA